MSTPTADSSDISQKECERCFAFLQTIHGQEFLQTCYEEREERKRISKPNTIHGKLLKLSEARKHHEWEAHKRDIFFYYMRNFSSAGILREITAAGYRFSSQSPRTCDNRLEAWGYPLNPQSRQIFMGRLRQEAAAWDSKNPVDLQNGFPIASGVPSLDAEMDPNHLSPNARVFNTPFEFGDSPTLGATKGKTITDIIEPLDKRAPKSIISNGFTMLDEMFQLDNLDASPRTIEESTNEHISVNPVLPSSASSFVSHESIGWGGIQEQNNTLSEYIDPSVLTAPSSTVKADTDSGYYSMEVVEKVTGYQELDDYIQEEQETAVDGDFDMVDPRPESPDQAYYQLFDANSMIPSNEMDSLLRQKLDPPRRSSILHTIPCRNDHMDVALGKRTVCDCGVTQIHAVCMCMIDLPDHHILTILGHVFKKDELDGAGNSPLHYVAAAGRKEVLEYMIASGINPRRLNAIGQSFLHVLDPSRFSDDLINFLEMFRDSGLLEQRDHNGRTVLHGLLRNPILPHVYHDLVIFYGPERAIQFSIRDNQGLNAAQHIRNVAQAQNPYASYGHVGYAQAIVVYENIANRFITQTEVPGNSIEETQNCIAVLRNSNPNVAHSLPNSEDSAGSNALHCLVLPPRTCTLEDTERRLDKLKQHIFFGADINHYDQAGRTPLLAAIIGSLSPTNESATKVIVELLCQSGANVYQKDRDGHTALYHAIRKGYCDCVAILLQHGAHVNCRASNGRSYRMLAQDYLQEHLLANDQEGFDKLQKRLAVVSALIAYKAVLEPTRLQAWGVDTT
ncbi:hypothetical protein OCU04_000272 [Sclerotinia nivalis]|uniref:Ankyrin repeat protein n=1 Tax=Sclerotinia nivalis TaxID=352851 RepID=A0A9X0DR47_9HELO|nr:hypothetical protein OCU04_000272 [Sclerotinia nivalis]